MQHTRIHEPVMVNDIIDILQPEQRSVLVDATIGTGGHARALLERMSPQARLIGIDQDSNALAIARERLKDFAGRFTLIHSNFRHIDRILGSLHIDRVDGVIADLGVSSLQLNDAQRGFSFSQDGPLDMRMDPSGSLSAFDLVNNMTKEEIASVLWRFGEERASRRIADRIITMRKKSAIRSTTELASIIARALPSRRGYQRIHPATRSFQALRMAVNQELESLEQFLHKISMRMKAAGRLCIISFHSLEDRMVKHRFREFAKTKPFSLLCKKPLTPSRTEIQSNPRARSAKLRAIERIQ